MTGTADIERLSRHYRGDLIAIIGTTTRVLDDCRLPNGALIEAPTHLPSFPSAALDRPRCFPGTDLALALISTDALDRDVRPALLPWLVQRLEDAPGELLAVTYDTNGQPFAAHDDLAGTMLLAAAVAMNLRSEIARQCLASLVQGLDSAFRDGRSVPEQGAWIALAPLIPLELNQFPPLRSAVADHPEARTVSQSPSIESLHNALELILPAALDHRSSSSAVAIPVCHRFAEVIGTAIAGSQADARLEFFAAIEAADASGHFPASLEQIEDRPSPIPYLLGHLLFLLAASLTGELARIPKSGYAGRRNS